MSIYDTILANTQQGYQNLANQQMQMAQMPTFADKFLAGLKEREQLDYQRKMAESNLAMNQAYKLAQEQHFAQQDEINRMNRQREILNYISQETRPENYGAVVSQIRSIGGDESWVPKQQFESVTTKTNLPSEYQTEQQMMAGEPYTEITSQMPIEGTGWGTQAWQKEQERQNRWDIANLNADQKMYLLKMKAMDPKSAAGKLEQDFANGLIGSDFFDQMRFKLGFVVNPAAGPGAGQGAFNIAPGLGPSRKTTAPIAPGATPPGAVAPGGGVQQAPRGPVQQPTSRLTIDPNSREGRAMAEKNSKIISAADDSLYEINNIRTKVNDLMGDVSKNSAMSTAGYALSFIPKTQAAAFASRVESLKAALMLNAMAMLKSLSTSGSTGMGNLSNAEGEVLKSNIASLSFSNNVAAFNRSLQDILDRMNKMEQQIKQHREVAIRGARGEMVAPPGSETGSVDTNNPLLR